MSTRFQPWQLTLAVIVFCMLVVGGLIWYRTSEQLTPAEFAALLPQVKGTVVYIDVKALRDAGLIERIAPPNVSQDPEYLDFVRESGFDYRQDLDTVAVAFDTPNIYAVLRGRFDWSTLLRYTRSRGGTCNVTFCRLASSQKGLIISHYAVFSNVLALSISTSDWGALAITRKNLPKSPPEVPSQSLWVSTSGQTVADSVSKLPVGTLQFAKALGSTERIVLAAGAAAGRYEITMDATCPTARDATVLLTELEGLTDMLRKLISREKQSPNPSDLSGVLTNGTFRKDDRHVHGHWPVERSFVDAVIGGS